MIETLLIIMAITQIISLLMIGLPVSCKIITNLGLRKNPEWFKEHSDFPPLRTVLKLNRGFISMLVAGSAVAVFYFVILVPSPYLYLYLTLVPLLIASVWFMVFIGVLQHFVIHKIPAPDRVSASLYDRRLSSFVPLWLIYLPCAALIGFLWLYGYSYVTVLIDPAIALPRVMGLAGFMVILIGMFMYTLKRKYSEMEVVMGPGGRKVEIWGHVVILYMGVFVGIWRMLGDFYGINILSDEIFFLCTGFAIQGLMLVYSFHPKVKAAIQNDFKDATTLNIKNS